jgi:hypothetical protein
VPAKASTAITGNTMTTVRAIAKPFPAISGNEDRISDSLTIEERKIKRGETGLSRPVQYLKVVTLT